MRCQRQLAALALAAALPGLAACTVAQGRSCDIQADAISMAATVIDEADGVQVEIEFEAGDMSGAGTSLQLCDSEGEQVAVNGVVLGEPTETYTGHFKYRAEFAESQASYDFEMTLGSDLAEVSATLVAPEPFEVSAPEPGLEVSRSTDLGLEWSPGDSGDTIQIELLDAEILCLENWSVETVDDGEHTVPADAIALSDEQAPDGKCEAEYVFTRQRSGEYPAQLQPGGSLEASVTRGLRFVSVP